MNIHEKSSGIENNKEDVNQNALYDENMILAIWDSYIRAQKGVYFTINDTNTQQILDSLIQADSLAPSSPAGLILNTDYSLFFNHEEKTVSVCGPLSRTMNAFEKIPDWSELFLLNLDCAIQGLKKWNNLYPDSKIENHQFLFPYCVSENHWALGIVELQIAKIESKSTTFTTKAYNPLPSCGGITVSETIVEHLEQLLKKEFGDHTIKQTSRPRNFRQQDDGSSCGTISAENGKYFLSHKISEHNPLEITYPWGAKILRQQHLAEVNREDFYHAQKNNISYYISKIDKPENYKDLQKWMEVAFSKIDRDAVNDFLSEAEKYDAKDLSNELAPKTKEFIRIYNPCFREDFPINYFEQLFNLEGECLVFKDNAVNTLLSLILDYIQSLAVTANPAFPKKITYTPNIIGENRSYAKRSTLRNFPTNFNRQADPLGEKSKTSKLRSKGRIELNDSNHIKTVNFIHIDNDNNNKKLPVVFSYGESWKDLRKFSIVTGLNGTGKTQLLKYIYNNLSASKQKNAVYITPTHRWDGLSSGSNAVNTSYVFSEKSQQKRWLAQVKNYYTNNVASDDSFAKEIIAKIDLRFKKGELIKNSITEDYILTTARRIIQYDQNELRLSEPLSFLTNIFEQYEERKRIFLEQAYDITHSLELFKYYEEISKDGPPEKRLDFRSFMEKIVQDDIFKNKLIKEHVEYQVGESPMSQINMILDNRFGYSIGFEPKNQDYPSRDKKIIFKNKNSLPIDPSDLSSGQIMIFSMLSWLYSVQGLSATGEKEAQQITNKINLLLLDEPDKHLDPKLCKQFNTLLSEEFVKRQNIQVIMTTHRIDTVALVSENEDSAIYSIEHLPSSSRISRIHKLEAMFKMSSSLRDLIDYHHKIYTESASDAQFYEGVYYSLKQWSDTIRERQAVNDIRDYKWGIIDSEEIPILEDREDRLLSSRYQMSFYSVSEKDSTGNLSGKGGCDKVKTSVLRDMTALENLSNKQEHWIKTRKIFTDIELYKSYGILDNDYEKNYNLDEKCDLILTREPPQQKTIKDLPLKNNMAYVWVKSKEGNNSLFFVDQDISKIKSFKDIDINFLNELALELKIDSLLSNNPRELLDEELEKITSIIGHNHKNNLKNYLHVLKTRHSLENFLLDPIIFCTCLKEKDILLCIDQSKIAELPDKKNDFITACQNIKHILGTKDYAKLQQAIDSYFSIIFFSMNKYHVTKIYDLSPQMESIKTEPAKYEFYHSDSPPPSFINEENRFWIGLNCEEYESLVYVIKDEDGVNIGNQKTVGPFEDANFELTAEYEKIFISNTISKDKDIINKDKSEGNKAIYNFYFRDQKSSCFIETFNRTVHLSTQKNYKFTYVLIDDQGNPLIKEENGDAKKISFNLPKKFKEPTKKGSLKSITAQDKKSFLTKNKITKEDLDEDKAIKNNTEQQKSNREKEKREKREKEEKPFYEGIKAWLGDKLFQRFELGDVEVQIIYDKDKVISLKYPSEFLKIRGHDIENFFIGKTNEYKPKDKIISHIYSYGLQYIPLDLIKIILDLNDKIRKNVRPIIKLNKFYPSEGNLSHVSIFKNIPVDRVKKESLEELPLNEQANRVIVEEVNSKLLQQKIATSLNLEAHDDYGSPGNSSLFAEGAKVTDTQNLLWDNNNNQPESGSQTEKEKPRCYSRE